MPSRSLFRLVLVGAGAALLVLLLFVGLRDRPEDPKPPPGFDPRDLASADPELDAPYVPTEHGIVNAMLEMGEVGPEDFVIDLGSGDGRILITAARDRGGRGLGVDIDPARIRDSRFNARAAGVENRVEFRRQDLFKTPISEADVLTLYLTPEINLRLRPRILAEMRPGTRVVSHAFDMSDWEWDERRRVENSNVYMWIVPARVSGAWILNTPAGQARLELKQEYGTLDGTITAGNRTVDIAQGEVEGDRVRFVANLGGGRRHYEGQVTESRIEPAAPADSTAGLPVATGWHAVRGP